MPLVLLLPAPVQAQAKEEPSAPVRIALVSGEKAVAIRNVLMLAEAKLTAEPGIQVLERQAIDRVLMEQKPTLSGLVAADQAVAVGKLLAVDLFAVLEAGVDRNEAAGLVVFDARTGVRLWDAALPPGKLDKTVAATVDAIHAARRKRGAIVTLRTVCLLTVRNADLPRSLDALCDSVGLLLERQLVASPDLALLERRRLEQVNQERHLPVDSPLRQLLASVVTVELEISSAPDGKGLRATALLSDGRGKSLGKTSAAVASRNAAALAEAVSQETTRALNAKAAHAEGGRMQEAGRFLREAEFSWEHEDPRRALRAAESAYALQPGDPTLRLALARGLLAQALDVLDPGGKLSVGSFVHKVEPETLVLSLALAHHGTERLIEGEADTTGVALTPSGNVHKMFAENHLHSYLQKVGGLTEGVTPAGRDGIEAVRTDRRRLQEIRFGHSLTAVRDKASFDRFTTEVNNSLMSVLDPSVSADQWTEALRRLQLWAETARKYEDVRAASSQSLLSRALFSYRYPRKVGEREVARLQKFWAELEQHPNATIAVYGRLGGLANALAFAKLTDAERRERVRDYRLFVQDRLEREARGPDVLRLNLYLAAADGIDLLINRPGHAAETKELCEFMFAHKELAPTLAQMTACYFLVHRKPEDYRYAYDVLQRALRILDGGEGRFLSYAESPMVLQFDRDHFRKEYLNRQAEIRQAAPEVGPATAAPWQKLVPLIDVYANKEGIAWIQRPVVHKGAVCVAAIRVEGTPEQHSIQLLRLSPDGGGRWEGRRLEIALRNQPWAGLPNNPFRLGIIFGVAACIHQERYYLGTKDHGIFVLPLDESAPERITEADGLPSDHVQGLACLGDRLFAYLGEPNKDSYLVAWDLKTRKADVLVSSRRKDKRSPFDDNTPLITSALLADPARERVLFSAYSPYIQHPLNGVWALDAKTDTFTRLFVLHHSDIGLVGPSSRLVGNELLLPSQAGLFTYDLVKNDHRLLHDHKVSLEVGPTRSALYSLGRMPEYRKWTDGRFDARPPYLIADGWLWAAAPFSRRQLDGMQEEQLTPLRTDQRFFQPTECLQRFRGDRELLVGDSFGLWLVTLPERN